MWVAFTGRKIGQEIHETKQELHFEKLLQIKVHPNPITRLSPNSNRNSRSEWIVSCRDQWMARSSIWKGLWLTFRSATTTLWEFTFWLCTSNKQKITTESKYEWQNCQRGLMEGTEMERLLRYVTAQTSRPGMSFWPQGVSFSPFDNLKVLH